VAVAKKGKKSTIDGEIEKSIQEQNDILTEET